MFNNFINSIVSFFSNGYHTIKRDDVIRLLEDSLNNYETNVLPSIDSLIDSKELKEIKSSLVLHELALACDMQQKDASNVLNKLKLSFENIVKNKRVIFTLIERGMSPVSTDRSIKAKDAAIVRLVSDLETMGLYMMDLLNIVVIGNSDTSLPPIRIKEIKNNIPTFGELYKSYGDIKTFNNLLKEIDDMSTVSLDISNSDVEAISYALGSEKAPALPLAKGFVGNPFYHIGMYMVDRDFKKADELELKAKLISLRLLELKQRQERAPTDELSKQIDVYEEELANLEYKIAKLRS